MRVLSQQPQNIRRGMPARQFTADQHLILSRDHQPLS
jgi:hypothetical protein